MKRRIISGVWVALAVGLLCFALYRYAAAETFGTQSFIFHGSYTTPYVVFVNRANGDIADKTTGTPAGGETWEANYIAAVQHSQSDFWEVMVPPLNDNYEWLICIGDAAVPTETDTVDIYPYSPTYNCVIDSETATTKGKILIRN